MLWFDLDNSPHVPLFRPIFLELKKRSRPVLVTARDFAQTKSLLELWNIDGTIIGEHGGRNKVLKVLNLFVRSQQLVRFVREKMVSLAVSHGSRTQVVAARRLGIPSVLMLDYEYTEARIFNTFANVLLMPGLIPDERLVKAGFNMKKIVRYAGLKEEIYLSDFHPEPDFRRSLGIDEDTILTVIRPPAAEGNYHDEKSEKLFRRSLEYFSLNATVQCLVLSRSGSDLDIIPPDLRKKRNITVLQRAVDGLQLIWNSDIVVSGGGTMNRESALLGTPTYSIFTGRRPYLDEYLKDQGKMCFVETFSEVDRIPILRKVTPKDYHPTNPRLPSIITDMLVDLSVRFSARQRRGIPPGVE